MNVDYSHPKALNSDRLVLSKGHATPALYGAWKETGHHIPEDIFEKQRQQGCIQEGHPTPKIPFADVGTGSLGQGLAVACGMAYGHKHFLKSSVHIWTILGDGELMEGSNWEAMQFASIQNLNNMVAILDLNKMGQSSWTSLSNQDAWNAEVQEQRAKAFGWHTIVVDGHDVQQLEQACAEARKSDKPTFIVARTTKGHSTTVSDVMGWHGKPLNADDYEKSISTLSEKVDWEAKNQLREFNSTEIRKFTDKKAYNFEIKESLTKKISTRKAFGESVLSLLDNDDSENFKFVALDADVGNSTFIELAMKKWPGRSVQC